MPKSWFLSVNQLLHVMSKAMKLEDRCKIKDRLVLQLVLIHRGVWPENKSVLNPSHMYDSERINLFRFNLSFQDSLSYSVFVGITILCLLNSLL